MQLSDYIKPKAPRWNATWRDRESNLTVVARELTPEWTSYATIADVTGLTELQVHHTCRNIKKAGYIDLIYRKDEVRLV